jgi:Na+/phosphate symporter
MEFKKILEEQEAFFQQVQQQMAQFTQGQPATVEIVIKQKRDLLAQTKRQISTAAQEKEETIRKYDREIKRYTEAIVRLEQEIEVLEKSRKKDGFSRASTDQV